MRKRKDFSLTGISKSGVPGNKSIARQRLVSYLESADLWPGLRLFRRRKTLADGRRLEFYSNYGVNRVRIITPDGGVEEDAPLIELITSFLESGWLDMTPILPIFNNPNPGHIYYTDFLKQRVNPDDETVSYLDEAVTLGQAPERGYTKGMESLALIPFSSKRGSIASFYGNGNYGSGKLKLAIQAELGLKEIAGQFINYTFLPYSLPEEIKRVSHVLYSGDDVTAPDYWLITIRTTNITAQKLKFDPDQVVYFNGEVDEFGQPVEGASELVTLQTLYDRLADATDDERNLIEAWLLANTFADSDVAELSDTFPDPPEGLPFAYGWKGNWKGTEAAMATGEEVKTDETPRTTVKWIGRLYKISINISGPDENGNYQFSASRSKLEEADYTPRQLQDLLWRPSFVETDQIFVSWKSAPGDYPEYFYDTEAPIYCSYQFVNGSEKLIVVRYNLTESENPYDAAEEVAFMEQGVCGPGSASDRFERWGASDKTGFYTEALGGGIIHDSQEIDWVNGSLIIASVNASLNGASTTVEANTTPQFGGQCGAIPDPGTWQNSSGKYTNFYEAVDHHVETFRAIGAGSTRRGESLCLIPFDSTEAWYMSSLKIDSGVFSWVSAQKDVVAVGTCSGDAEAAGEVTMATLAYNGSGGTCGLGIASCISVNDPGSPASNNYATLTIDWYLVHKHGVTQAAPDFTIDSDITTAHGSVADAEDSVYEQLGVWEQLYGPTLLNPYYTSEMRVHESAAGKGIVYHGDPNVAFQSRTETDGGDFPDDVTYNSGVWIGGA